MKFKRICCVVMAALMMISGMTVYATKASVEQWKVVGVGHGEGMVC